MKQPEALRLADALRDGTYLLSVERDVTAAELRRLHEANQAMLEALKWIDKRCPDNFFFEGHADNRHYEAAFDARSCARAAIAKGEQA